MYKTHAALLSTIFLLCCMEFLQSGMIAFASTPIMGEIGAGPEQYSLIAALYGCVAVIVISGQQWLIERLGWRSYILGSLAIYVVGALICGSSSRVLPFAAGRVVMAIGGASFMTSGRVLVTLIPPGPGRFIGISTFATGLAIGMAASPVLAALAVTGDDWSSIFWILIGAAIITGLLALKALPADPRPEEAWTHTGPARILLLSSASFLLLYTLQRSYYDFYDDRLILVVCALLGLWALHSFFRAERLHQRPLLRLRELTGQRYVLGLSLYSINYLILGADNYIFPVWMQKGLGFPWQSIGEAQSIGLLSALLTWLVMSRLLPKYPSPRKYFVVGFFALAMYGLQLASVTPDVNLWSSILPAIALHGVFVIAAMSTVAMQTFQGISHDDLLFSHGYQLKSMLAQLCTAFGIAFATVFLQWRTTVQYSVLNIHFRADDPLLSEQLRPLTQAFLSAGSPFASQAAMAQQAQLLGRHASLLAGIDYFSAVVCVGFALLVLLGVQRVFR